MVEERLYHLRTDQGYFETGIAQGKQLLLYETVHEIIAHWFDMDGVFLSLERLRMDVDPPTHPGTQIYKTDGEYWRAVETEVAAFKQRLGLRSADIRVWAFESEEASIEDLPGDFDEAHGLPEFDGPEDGEWYDEFVAEWGRKDRFVLCMCSCEYWMEADGEVWVNHS